MAKIKLYIAQSLNGKIAQKDGSVDWLNAVPNPEKTDYGFSGFLDSAGVTIQGYKTYKQLIDWEIEFPYKGKTSSDSHRDPDAGHLLVRSLSTHHVPHATGSDPV